MCLLVCKVPTSISLFKKKTFYCLKETLFPSVYEAVVAPGHKVVTVTPQLWVRPLLEEMKIYLKFYFISSLWCRGKERLWVLPLNTQCLLSSAESGEQSVLILGSLCLHCCGEQREAALFLFIYQYVDIHIVIVVKFIFSLYLFKCYLEHTKIICK